MSFYYLFLWAISSQEPPIGLFPLDIIDPKLSSNFLLDLLRGLAFLSAGKLIVLSLVKYKGPVNHIGIQVPMADGPFCIVLLWRSAGCGTKITRHIFYWMLLKAVYAHCWRKLITSLIPNTKHWEGLNIGSLRGLGCYFVWLYDIKYEDTDGNKVSSNHNEI